jgi:D-glucosaminate-6-phosphate ammonia-lyase
MSIDEYEAPFQARPGKLSRRELIKTGSVLGVPGLFGGSAVPSAPANAAAQGSDRGLSIYESIGVRPLINCRGTLTIVGGSIELPQVRAAMEAASQHHVHIDELMEGVGNRLAELTGAEWGIVTAGCAAGMAHVTAACVAGGNPDRHVRIPNLQGFDKNEVIIPKHSRNVYDASVRNVGVTVLEPSTVQELEAAFGPRTAMVYFFSGQRAESSPLPLEVVAAKANEKNVPVFVDAAAEMLTIPNLHLQKGATVVGYSGGKCLRGPQCAGLMIGRKDVLKAAWVQSAPHHGFGRPMKIGKEEIIGMLAAVEAWVKRDHQAEWKLWLSWLDRIAKRAEAVPGVKTSVREPAGINNHSPSLQITWDSAMLNLLGQEAAEELYGGNPRIALGGGAGRGQASGDASISITAYQMQAHEVEIVADRIYEVLSRPRKPRVVQPPKPPAENIAGRWDVQIEFAFGKGQHMLFLEQQGNQIRGTHQGDFVARELAGTIDGDAVRVRSSVPETFDGFALDFTFSGKVSGDTLSGDLDMGEYLKARWSAKKHRYPDRRA